MRRLFVAADKGRRPVFLFIRLCIYPDQRVRKQIVHHRLNTGTIPLKIHTEHGVCDKAQYLADVLGHR
jgi:hypothetical protein